MTYDDFERQMTAILSSGSGGDLIDWLRAPLRELFAKITDKQELRQNVVRYYAETRDLHNLLEDEIGCIAELIDGQAVLTFTFEDATTTVTIYTDTHRDACIDDVSDADVGLYDENIGRYFEYVKSQADEAGITLTFEDSGSGRSYYTETDDGELFMDTLLDFWRWYTH